MLFANYPIVSLLLQPRKTINRLVGEKKYPNLWIFVVLYGLLYTLSINYERVILKSLDLRTLGLSLLFIIFAGFASVLIISKLLQFIGIQFGGKGSNEELKSAIMWGSVPQAVGLLIISLVFLIVFFDTQLGIGIVSPTVQIQLVIVLNVLRRASTIIGFFYLIVSLAEAHKYSVFKAFLSLLLGSIIFVILYILFFYVYNAVFAVV